MFLSFRTLSETSFFPFIRIPTPANNLMVGDILSQPFFYTIGGYIINIDLRAISTSGGVFFD